MQILSFLIFFPGSNYINQNPNPDAVYAFDPCICILQQLVLSAKLATKMACLCLRRIGEAISDIKSLIYQKNLFGLLVSKLNYQPRKVSALPWGNNSASYCCSNVITPFEFAKQVAVRKFRKSFEHCQLVTAWHTPHQTWTCVDSKIQIRGVLQVYSNLISNHGYKECSTKHFPW